MIEINSDLNLFYLHEFQTLSEVYRALDEDLKYFILF